MSDYQEENPYASPLGAADAALPEIRGVWRDGDELVVLPRDMQAPKACWVTNESSFVSRCAIISYSRASLALTVLLFIPLIGIVLYLIAAIPLIYLGYVRGRSPVAWLCWGPKLRQAAGAITSGGLMAVGFILCCVAGFALSFVVLLMAVPFIIGGMFFAAWSDRLTIGLRTRYGENGTYRIRGVHPDYLARLPDYNESGLNAVAAAEPGDSPFRIRKL